MTTLTTATNTGPNRTDPHRFSELEVLSAAQRERAEYVGDLLDRGFARIGRALRGLFGTLRREQRLYNELSALDDRMLADIGITRGDIPYVVKGAAIGRNAGNDNAAKAA